MSDAARSFGTGRFILQHTGFAGDIDAGGAELRRAVFGGEGAAAFQPVEGVERDALAAASIVSAGDVCGAVVYLCDGGRTSATEAEMKLVTAAANFLGKQMEE